MNKTTRLILVVLIVLILDQSLKIWVKTSMEYGEEFAILGLSWAKIHFVENEGMAFGLTLGTKWWKIMLSLFRIGAVVFLIYLIRSLIREGESFGLVFSFGLILAGALGNIIDSAFYGMIFSESPYHGSTAELFPEGGGYSAFLMGKVVDMFYFPLIDTYWPEWIPLVGGQRFEFFKPVFNVADSAITTGVLSILLFHRRVFTKAEQSDSESRDSEHQQE